MACDIWIGNREHPSALLPLCQPCARQLLWSKEDPLLPTFMQYVAFLLLAHDGFVKDKKQIRKYTTLLVIPNPAADMAAKHQRRSRSCCQCRICSIIVGDFSFTLMQHTNFVYRSKPSRFFHCFCFHHDPTCCSFQGAPLNSR